MRSIGVISMMYQNKLLELVDALCSGTSKGTVKWTDTTDENAFRATLRSGIVRIEKYGDPRHMAGEGAVGIFTGMPFNLPQNYKSYEQEVYTLVVLDDNNRELARYIPEIDTHALTLRNLWEVAMHSARNSEQKLNDILQEIKGKV